MEIPRSEESERAILAAALLDAEVLARVRSEVSEASFYLDRHRVLWRSIAALADAGTPVDLRTVQADLERRGDLDKAGGVAYLAGLDLDLPDLGRIDAYVQIVRDCAVRREALARAQEVILAVQGDGPTAELVEAAEASYRALGQRTGRRRAELIGTVSARAMESIEDGGGHLVGVPSGFASLDAITYGLGAGRLIVIAGRPGMGKSSLALNMLQHVAIRERRGAAIFSLEMTADELAQRVLCSEARVPFSRLRTRHLAESHWSRLVASLRDVQDAPLRIQDAPVTTVRDIVAEARRLREEGALEVLAIDYLQLMDEPGNWRGNRNLEVAAISRAMKRLALELDISVLLLSQLSRDPERRGGDRRPRLPDLRDSGAIEQDADLVAFVHREEVYQPDDPEVRGLAEVIIAKHRNGALGTVELAFDGETTTFRERDPHRPLWTPPQAAAASYRPAEQEDPF